MNSKSEIQFGSEVYTWFMNGNGEKYKGRLGEMIEVISSAGFTGIQPIHFWMGDLTDPYKLKIKLEGNSIKLAAISLVLEWNGRSESTAESTAANNTINLLKQFPGALLCMVQLPTGRHDIKGRRKTLVKIVNEISIRAAEIGVPSTFHPNSPDTSITRTEEDYSVILENLNTKTVGWTPDVGHIINAGMEPLEKMKQYAQLINHVHYKDWDGKPEFTLMGSGNVDFVSITNWLQQINYKGWIICEDEGKEALDDPDGVTMHDGRWIREILMPQIQ